MKSSLPPIWVINLKRSPQRKEAMKKMLDSFQLDYEFIEATDGKKLTEEDWSKYSKWRALIRTGRGLHRNEIGCSLSHYRCYKRMIEEGHDEVLIMEDDINFGEDFIEILKRRDEFSVQFERINFRHNLTPSKTFLLGKPIYKNYHLTVVGDFNDLTGCYLITNKGARKILDNYLPIDRPIDNLIGASYKVGFVTGGIHPQVVHLNRVESDIWVDTTTVSFSLYPFERWTGLKLKYSPMHQLRNLYYRFHRKRLFLLAKKMGRAINQ